MAKAKDLFTKENISERISQSNSESEIKTLKDRYLAILFLEQYGMPDNQIKELIKKGKVKTGHGIYEIKGEELLLNGEFKCFVLKSL